MTVSRRGLFGFLAAFTLMPSLAKGGGITKGVPDFAGLPDLTPEVGPRVIYDIGALLRHELEQLMSTGEVPGVAKILGWSADYDKRPTRASVVNVNDQELGYVQTLFAQPAEDTVSCQWNLSDPDPWADCST